MLYVTYEQAVDAMERGLSRFLAKDDARRFAEIFAGNSLDGVRAPGENLAATREKHLREGLPVAEETWEKILKAGER